MSQLTTAPSPFDQESADIIFHTSDYVAYHVHTVILAQASAFFRAMFSLPQPQSPPSLSLSPHRASQSIPSRIPIIEIEESSETLHALLTIIYPIPKPQRRAFAILEPALLAAEKYNMELVVDTLQEDLHIATLNPVVGPLPVWAVACRLHLEDIAQHAAAHLSLSQLEQLVDLSIFCGVTAGQYFRLREFCRQRAETAFPAFKMQLLDQPEIHLAVMDEASNSTLEPEAAAFLRTVPFPDVVVRSLDGVEIPAHGCVLAMASPVLRKKLTALHRHDACGDNPQGSELPILQLAEPSALLWNLLASCCYFRAQYLDVDLSQLALMIGAAEKYEMEEGLRTLRGKWADIVEHSGNPLVAYLVAASAGPCMADCAKDAATLVLRQPDSILATYQVEMEDASALVYHRILVYYKECNAAIVAEIDQVLMEYPTLVRWRRHRPLSLPSHGTVISSFSDCEWESPRFVGEVQWPLHLFLDGISRSNTRGPQRKIDSLRCDAILREYVSWGSTELPDRPRTHVRELFDIALKLANRLETAMKQADVHIQ